MSYYVNAGIQFTSRRPRAECRGEAPHNHKKCNKRASHLNSMEIDPLKAASLGSHCFSLLPQLGYFHPAYMDAYLLQPGRLIKSEAIHNYNITTQID